MRTVLEARLLPRFKDSYLAAAGISTLQSLKYAETSSLKHEAIMKHTVYLCDESQ